MAPSADGESAWEDDGGGQAGTTETRRVRTSAAARSMNNMKWQEVEEPEEEDYEPRPVGLGLRPGV